MDLHSRHPSILEQDFLTLDEQANASKWDLISLSLVVNFVPKADDRGDYSTRITRSTHAVPRPNAPLGTQVSRTQRKALSRCTSIRCLGRVLQSHLRQLPLPCVNNSRYMDFDHLRSLMRVIGFEQLKERWRPAGKMAYWLYVKVEPMPQAKAEPFRKKIVLKQGNRNNFCILLP